ncbi:MAG: hypothetical protein GY851_35505 [bacterium]|nr:hypothetical protein [bacterium]
MTNAPNDTPMVRKNLFLPRADYARMQAAARRQDRSFASWARRLLNAGLAAEDLAAESRDRAALT